MTFTSKSIEDTNEIAGKITHQYAKISNLFCLYGELGSGKTTLTQAIGIILGIKSRINSPTFLIQKEHLIDRNIYGFKNLYHLDLFRIEDPEDLIVSEMLKNLEDKSNLVIIEWAEKIYTRLPRNRLDIFIKNIGSEERLIKVEYAKS